MRAFALVIFAIAAAACAREVTDLECVPYACPFMLRVDGAALSEGDNVINIASGKLTLRGLQLATGTISGGWKADGVSVDKLIVSSSGSWSQNAYAYTYLEEHEDSLPLQTRDGSPIGAIDICYHFHLLVQKSASPCYTKRYTWSIEVTTPVTGVIELTQSQSYSAPFTYTMSRTSALENFVLSGSIFVQNPDPINSVEIEEVRDVYGGALLEVHCPYALPFVLGPGKDVVCTYEHTVTCAAGEMPPGVNFAEVVVGDGALVGGSSVTLDLDWAVCEVLDECVFERDGATGAYLGENCDAGYVPNRSVTVPFVGGDCGAEVPLSLEAYLEGKDTHAVWASSTGASVVVKRICATGCTLTHGYWKTHGKQGPARYDARWELITPSGEYTPFFASGKTYYQAINSESVASPAGYYKLAVQYIAAKLNVLSGASIHGVTSDVEGAMRLAEAYFEGSLSPTLAQLTAAAALIDRYNNGLLGEEFPRHCAL